jgi:hypothetical protein
VADKINDENYYKEINRPGTVNNNKINEGVNLGLYNPYLINEISGY